MPTATMTSKGQLTIPLEVRRRMGLEAGTRIAFVELEDGAYAIQPEANDVRLLKGLLPPPPKSVSIEDMNAAIRRRGAGK